jgi:hypothetical protein
MRASLLGDFADTFQLRWLLVSWVPCIGYYCIDVEVSKQVERKLL